MFLKFSKDVHSVFRWPVCFALLKCGVLASFVSGSWDDNGSSESLNVGNALSVSLSLCLSLSLSLSLCLSLSLSLSVSLSLCLSLSLSLSVSLSLSLSLELNFMMKTWLMSDFSLLLSYLFPSIVAHSVVRPKMSIHSPVICFWMEEIVPEDISDNAAILTEYLDRNGRANCVDQIRLLLLRSSLIRVYTVCYPASTILSLCPVLKLTYTLEELLSQWK